MSADSVRSSLMSSIARGCVDDPYSVWTCSLTRQERNLGLGVIVQLDSGDQGLQSLLPCLGTKLHQQRVNLRTNYALLTCHSNLDVIEYEFNLKGLQACVGPARATVSHKIALEDCVSCAVSCCGPTSMLMLSSQPPVGYTLLPHPREQCPIGYDFAILFLNNRFEPDEATPPPVVNVFQCLDLASLRTRLAWQSVAQTRRYVAASEFYLHVCSRQKSDLNIVPVTVQHSKEQREGKRFCDDIDWYEKHQRLNYNCSQDTQSFNGAPVTFWHEGRGSLVGISSNGNQVITLYGMSQLLAGGPVPLFAAMRYPSPRTLSPYRWSPHILPQLAVTNKGHLLEMFHLLVAEREEGAALLNLVIADRMNVSVTAMRILSEILKKFSGPGELKKVVKESHIFEPPNMSEDDFKGCILRVCKRLTDFMKHFSSVLRGTNPEMILESVFHCTETMLYWRLQYPDVAELLLSNENLESAVQAAQRYQDSRSINNSVKHIRQCRDRMVEQDLEGMRRQIAALQKELEEKEQELMIKGFGDHMESRNVRSEEEEGMIEMDLVGMRQQIAALYKELCEREQELKAKQRSENHMESRNVGSEEEKGGDHEKYLAACEKAMHKKGKLNQTIIPCVFVGPPGNGKTTLMRRLIGKLPLPSLPSTGVAEKVIQVHIRRSSSTAAQLNRNSSVWKELTLDNEAVALLMDISKDQTLESCSDTPSQPSNSPIASANTSPIASADTSPIASTDTSPIASANTSTATEAQLDFQSQEAIVPPPSFIAPLEMFKDILHREGWSAARTYLEGACIAHLTDTGGQLEFQELLPALVSGPSVFFLVFRLDQDLNQRFTVEYRHPSKGCTKPYESSYTVTEFLLHTLASIASMGNYTYKGVQKKQVPMESKVFFVGTHKDKVSKEEIEEIDHDLLQKIKRTDHYKSGIIQFAREKHLIIPVNSLSPDDSDIQLVRSAVERIRGQGHFDVSAPPQWLIFSLALRKLKESVVTYDECSVVAKQCGIDTLDELNDALGFLSTKVGLIRYFQGANVDEDLQEIVIQDPQVLFDGITNFIIATFTFKNADPVVCEDFQKKGIFSGAMFEEISSKEGEKKGIFSSAMFEEISSKEGEKLLTPSRLLKVLQHLHIIAPIQESSDNIKYFIPCILAHAAMVNPEPSVGGSEMTNVPEAPPLLVCFSCGYCPRGLFCALVVYLLNKSRSPSWKLMEYKGIFRNQISFSVGCYDYVSLTVSSTSKFIKVNCTPSQVKPRTSDFATVCREVRCTIESGVKAVASTLHYKYNPADLLKFGFYCPHSHPAEIRFCGRNPRSLECSECKDPFQNLPRNYEVWFDETCGRKSSPAQFSLDSEVESEPPQAKKPKYEGSMSQTISPGHGSEHISGTTQAALDEVNTPDLMQLLKFPGKTKNFSVANEIGIRYKQFGIFLLNDSRGAKVDAIAREHNNVSELINIEILQLWLGGEGRDISWRTLVEVLNDIGLGKLATEIAEVKNITMSA